MTLTALQLIHPPRRMRLFLQRARRLIEWLAINGGIQ
jgi:hypothetical protein